MDGLRNGLTAEENARLATTTDPTTILQLVLRGLSIAAARLSETEALTLLLDATVEFAPSTPPHETPAVLQALERLPKDIAPGYLRDVAEVFLVAHPRQAATPGRVAVRGGADHYADLAASALTLLRDDLPALAAFIAGIREKPNLRKKLSPAVAATVFDELP